jgi:hypothetical protein
MTLAEITRSPTRRAKSAGDVVADLDGWKLVRLVVWIAFCIALIVFA